MGDGRRFDSSDSNQSSQPALASVARDAYLRNGEYQSGQQNIANGFGQMFDASMNTIGDAAMAPFAAASDLLNQLGSWASNGQTGDASGGQGCRVQGELGGRQAQGLADSTDGQDQGQGGGGRLRGQGDSGAAAASDNSQNHNPAQGTDSGQKHQISVNKGEGYWSVARRAEGSKASNNQVWKEMQRLQQQNGNRMLTPGEPLNY